MRRWVFMVIFVCAVAFLGGRASAGGAPTVDPLVYAGVLTDGDGGQMTKSKAIQVLLFDNATDNGVAAKCSSDTVQTEAGTGRFEVSLPGDCAAAVHANADLWVEIAVIAGSGKVVLPRVKLGAVPYALEAAKAMTADGASGGLASTLSGVQDGVAKAAKQADLDALAIQVGGIKADLAAITNVPVSSKVTAYSVGVSDKPAGFQTGGGKLVLIWSGYVQAANGSYTFNSQVPLTIDANVVATVTISGTAVIGPLPAGAHTVMCNPGGGAYCAGKVTFIELP